MCDMAFHRLNESLSMMRGESVCLERDTRIKEKQNTKRNREKRKKSCENCRGSLSHSFTIHNILEQ